jgi:hypothetical protein
MELMSSEPASGLKVNNQKIAEHEPCPRFCAYQKNKSLANEGSAFLPRLESCPLWI